MIHFGEKIKIYNEFHKWLMEKNEEIKEKGYAIADNNMAFLIFLNEKGLLNEEAIHEKYLRR